MKYYAIGDSVKVQDFISPKKALATANAAVDGVDELYLFKTQAAAEAYAKELGEKHGNKVAYPVIEVEVAKKVKLTALQGEKNAWVLDAVKNEFQIFSASLQHVNKKHKIVDFSAEDEVENENSAEEEVSENEEVSVSADENSEKAEEVAEEAQPGFFARNKNALMLTAGVAAGT